MNISPIDAIANAGSGTNPATGQIMGKDDFMQLLVTQLQHQDPLNPTDSTEFTAQLAQFSSLEQLGNINTNLEDLQLYQASINNAQAVSFIGKEISAHGDTIELANGESVSCRFELDASAEQVVVNIYDQFGNYVRTLEAAGLAAGDQALTWDGKDSRGGRSADGEYRFEVLASGVDDEPVNAKTFTTGTVTGVTFVDNATYLMAGGRQIAMGDVVEVHQGTTPSESAMME
jgi:flagellar basal-body rod modification protein FlgD